MTDNPFVEAIELEEGRARVIANIEGWRARFASDARLSRKHPWMMGRGHWSWTVTREQYRRFVRSEDPLIDFPDEIFDGWVYDGRFELGIRSGVPLDRVTQKAIFDAYIAERKKA